MKNKDQILLEGLYSKILNENQPEQPEYDEWANGVESQVRDPEPNDLGSSENMGIPFDVNGRQFYVRGDIDQSNREVKEIEVSTKENGVLFSYKDGKVIKNENLISNSEFFGVMSKAMLTLNKSLGLEPSLD
jgi:hypothetical protein